MTSTEPLPGDKSRQADAMLSACDYQILQTVNAWLDLRGNDALYVEGAEDFDVVSSSSAEAVQIKTSPAPISLGQKEIHTVINRYWALKFKTAGRNVRLKYLTRAPFTVERAKPFGANTAGLHMWSFRPISDEDVNQIRDFLIEQNTIEDGLKRWLRNAKEKDIREDLLNGISWETSADDISGVERSIWCKLVTFAEGRDRVPASVIRKISLRLKEEIWMCLREPGERRLDCFHIEEIWEQETCVSIPRSALVARQSIGASQSISDRRDEVQLLRKGIPPLPGIVARRGNLVRTLRDVLSETQILILHGSARMGKTTLAKLVAEPDADSWRWWSFAGSREENLPRSMQMLAKEIAASPEAIDVVIDDLDFSAGAFLGGSDVFGEILALLRNRRGRLIITSQREISVSFAHSHEIEPEQIVRVPRLDPDEVTDLARALGCRDENQCFLCGRIVHANSGGHPPLAAARLLALKREGWPPVAAEVLQSSIDAVTAERFDAFQVMTATLEEPQRSMLLRLSAFSFAFRRDQGVELGATPPPIGLPGGIIDGLIGPWIEPLHAGYFTLSPLLSNLARNTLAKDEFHRLQDEAAMTLLRCKPCSQVEFGHAFYLFWQTKNEGALGFLVQSWLEMDEILASSLREELWWFALVATQPGQRLYEENPSLSLLLRALQLRIACKASQAHVKSLVDSWRWELENSKDGEPILMRMTFSMSVLINTSIEVRAAEVLQMLADVKAATDSYPDMPFPMKVPRGGKPELDYIPEWNDAVATLSFTCSMRCGSPQFFDDFLDGLDKMDSELRQSILTGFVCSGLEAQMALDRIWLGESEKDLPDWDYCLKVFEKGLELGRKWSCPDLATASMRASIVVIDEFLNNHQGAHDALDRMSMPGDLLVYSVHDRRACIFFSEGKFRNAEEEWRMALEAWPVARAPFDNGSAYAARSAGVSAARESRWIEAADWFRLSIARLPKNDHTAYIAGCYADAGYCLWKAEQNGEAVTCLIEAWCLADTLATGRQNLVAFVKRKTVGHVIAWINGMETGSGVDGLCEPIVGIASSLELPEGIRELPETQSSYIWHFLMRLERQLNVGFRAREMGAGKVRSAVDDVSKFFFAMEEVAYALCIGEFDDLPLKAIHFSRETANAAKNAPPGTSPISESCSEEHFNAEDPLVGRLVFVAGIIAAHDHGMDVARVVNSWRGALPSSASSEWCDWFDVIERRFLGSVAESIGLARSPKGSCDEVLLASWHVLLTDGVSADDVFCAHARILSLVRHFHWLPTVGAAFCRRIESVWQKFLASPALLRSPRITIPAIRSACLSGEASLKKSAMILFAASGAVSLKIGPEIRNAILRGVETRKPE